MLDPQSVFDEAYDLTHGRPPGRRQWKRALGLWRQAAKAGHVDAMFHLGVCYDYGFGTVRDLAAAAEWYMKAARKGDATAQLNIARCLREGDGLEVDKEAAYSWYLKAAKEGGMAEAWLDVGYARFYGIGAEMDMIGAVDAYRRAAKAGVVAAQYNLGLCYKYGDGVRRNMAHALAWLRKAARGGHRRAEAIVKRITGTE